MYNSTNTFEKNIHFPNRQNSLQYTPAETFDVLTSILIQKHIVFFFCFHSNSDPKKNIRLSNSAVYTLNSFTLRESGIYGKKWGE